VSVPAPPPAPPEAPPAPTDVSLAPALALPAKRSRVGGLTTGLRAIAASAFFFSVMSLLVKLAAEEGIPSMQIVLVRCAVMTACSLALLRHVGVSPLGRGRATLLLRGTVGATALSLLFFALGRLPLGDATAIHYTAPLWTTLGAGFFLNERIGKAISAGIVLSLAGVVLVAKPSVLFGGASLEAWGVAAAVVGSLLSGISHVLVRKLRKTDHPVVVVLWLSWVGVALALPFVAVEGWAAPTAYGWALLIGTGLTTQVAQVLMTRGFHEVEAGRASAVGYLQVVFAFGWSALVFGVLPDMWTLAGAALIVASTVLIARRS